MSLPKDELKVLIMDAVNTCLQFQSIVAPEMTVRTILDINDFCAYTGLSKQTVYRKTASGEIPHSKRGKRLYFDKNEIDEWLMANKVSPERMEDKTEQYFSNKRSSMRQKK